MLKQKWFPILTVLLLALTQNVFAKGPICQDKLPENDFYYFRVRALFMTVGENQYKSCTNAAIGRGFVLTVDRTTAIDGAYWELWYDSGPSVSTTIALQKDGKNVWCEQETYFQSENKVYFWLSGIKMKNLEEESEFCRQAFANLPEKQRQALWIMTQAFQLFSDGLHESDGLKEILFYARANTYVKMLKNL